MTPEGLVRRVRGEYYEMPGLGLTLAQASRLWHIDAVTCQTVLTRLVNDGFLYRMRDGRYVAATITTREADPRAPRQRYAHPSL